MAIYLCMETLADGSPSMSICYLVISITRIKLPSLSAQNGEYRISVANQSVQYVTYQMSMSIP